jgi:serine/threonine-protein kinase
MSAEAWLVGERFGAWQVTAFLAEGGMARVWQVRHGVDGREGALKVPRSRDPDLLARAAREGRIQSGLAHPNLLAALDIVDVGGAPGIVLELVPGGLTLERALAMGPLEGEVLERLLHGLLDGVEAAHRAGFIHRDLKPANVLLSESAGGMVPRVADFGLARPEFEPPESRMTRMGVIMGSAAYMAPEQARDAGSVDARADVWSLGVMLYEMLTGVQPFVGDTLEALLADVSRARYRPLDAARPGVDPHWNVAVEGCLQVDPARRIPDVPTLRAVIRREQPWVGGGSGRRTPASVRSSAPSRRRFQAPAAATFTTEPPTEARRWPRGMAVGAVVIAVLLLGGVLFSGLGHG